MIIDQAIEILDKWEFFYGQRAGRELWADKPTDVQNEDIANFCRDLGLVREALERTRWIPCSERLPKMIKNRFGVEYSETVFALTSGGRIMAASLRRAPGDKAIWIAPFNFRGEWDERITHWAESQPLPEPPEEENDETIDG